MENSSDDDTHLQNLNNYSNQNVLKRRRSLANAKYYLKIKDLKKQKKPSKNISTNNDFNEITIQNTIDHSNTDFFNDKTNEDFIANSCSSRSESFLSEESLSSSSISEQFSEDSSLASDSDYFETNLTVDSTEFVYLSSNVTIKQLALSFLSLKYNNKLSEKTIDDVLKLFGTLLPQPNKCPKTSRALLNILQIDNNEIRTDHKTQTNTNEEVNFSIFKIEPQLKKIISNKNYLEQIRKSNLLINKTQNNDERTEICSALDGVIYRNLQPSQNDEIIVSLNINSDGAPIVKSRSFSIWPVLASIIELNQSSREKFENILLLGIWLHQSKPNKHFFDKAFEELDQLSKNIFQIDNLKIKIRCQSGIFDLPAQAMILNVKQFNGEFGCISCFHPGQFKGPGYRVYPYSEEYQLKTNDHYIKYNVYDFEHD